MEIGYWLRITSNDNQLYRIKTHVVKIVKQIPADENTSGTSAHGDNQSIISAGILSHPVTFTLGRQPGPHDMHVSLRAKESMLHLTHTLVMRGWRLVWRRNVSWQTYPTTLILEVTDWSCRTGFATHWLGLTALPLHRLEVEVEAGFEGKKLKIHKQNLFFLKKNGFFKFNECFEDLKWFLKFFVDFFKKRIE